MSQPGLTVNEVYAALRALGLPLAAMPPIELDGAATYTIPIPDNCVAWEIYLVGGGGSGGACEGDSTNEMNCSGGAGGSYAHGIRPRLAASTAITVVLGAGGAAVTETSGATAGNAGASSTATDGTVTFTTWIPTLAHAI